MSQRSSPTKKLTSQGTTDEVPSAEALARNPELMQQALQAYIQHKAGPFVGAPTTTGFASLEKIQPDFPNAESHIQSLLAEHQKKNPAADPAGRDPLLARQLLDPKEAVCQIVGLPSGANLAHVDTPSKLFPLLEEDGMWMVLGACSTRSFSRGSVHICSAAATQHPAIDPAYFAHPLDLDLVARALLHTLSFTDVEPLKSALRRTPDGAPVVAQASGGKVPRTLDEAKEFVRRNTVTEYHPVGTCAMLAREKGGVVDARLRVHGTRNVRVCDASIFPLHVQGNIVSLVYAVAEKGADIIRGEGKVNGANGMNGTNGVNGH